MFVIWSAKVSNSFPPTLLYRKNLRKIIIIGFLKQKNGCRVVINMAVWNIYGCKKIFDMLKAYKSFDVNQIFSIFVP